MKDREIARNIAERLECRNNAQCFWPDTDCSDHEKSQEMIIKALESVRADERADERAECAKIAEQFFDSRAHSSTVALQSGRRIATAIRERGKGK